MEKLGAVVKIEYILVGRFDIDCETTGADRLGVGNRKIGRIVGLEKRRVAIRTHKLIGTGIAARVQDQGVEEMVAFGDVFKLQRRIKSRLECGNRRKAVGVLERNS